MNILPDYLITYMPEIEAALEELRLSVLDHAYELLQRLDIDELSTDEIRQKLELYNVRVENMIGDWLPNGRFYRLYPSIKHHRSRHNTIKAIAKSGGQFEGLWSTDFSNKSAFQFNSIQVARHYELQTNADGYFFVSGNTQKDAKGRVISSASQALTTDVLINQALPAGYTYLYVPWPRPTYPGDSSYFYAVNMLMHDRLQYAEDCDHTWILHDDSNEEYSIYYCLENSDSDGGNRYCKVPKNQTDTSKISYSNAINSNNELVEPHPFNSEIDTDAPFTSGMYDESKPASTKYDWQGGTNTPWRTPYWIDYHYMNNMNRSLPSTSYAGTWPVAESGDYYDENGDVVFELKDAVTYQLDDKCLELSSTESVFPTRCYLKERMKTTEPNRLQKFEPGNIVLNIHQFNINTYNTQAIDVICESLKVSRDNLTKHYKKVKCSAEIVTNESDQYVLQITLLDEEYSDYNGDLLVSYNVNDNYLEGQTVTFTNGSWTSTDVYDIYPSISNVVVVDPSTLYFIINDEVKYKFENKINTIVVDNSHVYAYNQAYNTWADAECLFESNEIRFIVDNVPTVLSKEEFTNDGWILVSQYGYENPTQSYYGNDVVNVYEDEIDTIAPEYFKCNYGFDVYNDSIDSNDLTDITKECIDTIDETGHLKYPGQYRWDILVDRFAWHIHESLHHIKSYKPFWNEKTPWLEMTQSKYVSYEDENPRHSLYNWMNLKQTENIPSVPFNFKESDFYDLESVIRDNNPPISEITFGSFDRPTRGKLDPIYVGYLSNDVNLQDDNQTLNNSSIYIYDNDPVSGADHDPIEIEYDPDYHYTIISLNYKDESDQQLTVTNQLWDSSSDRVDHIYADFIGDPYARTLKIREHTNNNHHIESGVSKYNYITFKKSRIHKLWFSGAHKNTTLTANGQSLYNFYGDNSIYEFSSNGVLPKYTIVEVYDESNRPLGYTSGTISCVLSNDRYNVKVSVLRGKNNELITNAAYVLFTVKTVPGAVEHSSSEDIESSVHFGMGTSTREYSDIGLATYHGN